MGGEESAQGLSMVTNLETMAKSELRHLEKLSLSDTLRHFVRALNWCYYNLPSSDPVPTPKQLRELITGGRSI